jgi:hypothetical protein
MMTEVSGNFADPERHAWIEALAQRASRKEVAQWPNHIVQLVAYFTPQGEKGTQLFSTKCKSPTKRAARS